MTKKIVCFASLLFVLSVTSAHAQGAFGGCVDSPENPTLILAGLAAGAYAVSSLRTRIQARRRSNTEHKDVR